MTAAVSQFSGFSAVRIFRWLQFLKLSGYTAVQQNFHREREGAAAATGGGGGGTTMATRMGPCRSAAGRWVRVRGRANFLKGGDPLLPLSLRPCMWFWQKQI